MEKRALSWQEFLGSGFDGRDYNFPDFEGTFEAEMVCKRWDKNSKLLVYLDFDDGRKIITSAWQDSNYKGLADVPFNTRVRVTFQYSKKGISYVCDVLLPLQICWTLSCPTRPAGRSPLCRLQSQI